MFCKCRCRGKRATLQSGTADGVAALQAALGNSSTRHPPKPASLPLSHISPCHAHALVVRCCLISLRSRFVTDNCPAKLGWSGTRDHAASSEINYSMKALIASCHLFL